MADFVEISGAAPFFDPRAGAEKIVSVPSGAEILLTRGRKCKTSRAISPIGEPR